MSTPFLLEHLALSRRYFLSMGVFAAVTPLARLHGVEGKAPKAGAQPEPYFTTHNQFQDVSRGNPLPHRLPLEKKQEVGMTRETWKLEVLSDPQHPVRLSKPLLKSTGTALDFEALLKLGEKHAVRFPKIMTCLNLGCPLGMGLWEGVPLRHVIWMTQPRDNLRRVFYYGYHNDDPQQMFRSSLPISRVLEDPFDLPPVILCYKLNGQWLDAERGGPVRMIVPEAYGFKSIKWLSHVVLTNLAYANDTYAEQNNDVDSPLKTYAAPLVVPEKVQAGKPIAVSGYAQVGLSGLKKVQVSLELKEQAQRENDPYSLQAPWVDAQLLPAPRTWGALPEGKIPPGTLGFNDRGEPLAWPMRLTNSHWAAVLPAQAAGVYTFKCRSIDAQGQAQPLPRPFRKLGYNAIQTETMTVM
jgi:DMSO/TMAO reductase YedYZ molybdopterin-dependent catalytic subunit